MNKITTLIFIVIGLVSCVTQRRCLVKFPLNTDTVRVVSFHDTIVYRDTTIFIHLPGTIKTDTIIIPCPPPLPTYIPDTAKAETSLAIAKAWWKYPVIHLKLVQKDTTIETRLKNAIRDAIHWRIEYNQIKTTVEKKKIPVIYALALGGWIGILILIMLFVAWKLFIKRL